MSEKEETLFRLEVCRMNDVIVATFRGTDDQEAYKFVVDTDKLIASGFLSETKRDDLEAVYVAMEQWIIAKSNNKALRNWSSYRYSTNGNVSCVDFRPHR